MTLRLMQQLNRNADPLCRGHGLRPGGLIAGKHVLKLALPKLVVTVLALALLLGQAQQQHE